MNRYAIVSILMMFAVACKRGMTETWTFCGKFPARGGVMIWQVSIVPDGSTTVSPVWQLLFDRASWLFSASVGALFGLLMCWSGQR